MGRRCKLTIQSAQVEDLSTDNVNFPVLLYKKGAVENIPWSDIETYAKVDGDDIRVFRDDSDTYRCPVEIVTFDKTNDICEIWTRDIQISSSADTDFYIRYGEASWTGANYGDVWSSFAMVQHMNEDPSGTPPQMIDSTTNSNDGTTEGTMLTADLVDGQIGDALDLDGSNDAINCGTGTTIDDIWTNGGYLSCWWRPHTDGISSSPMIASKRSGAYGWSLYYSGDPSPWDCIFKGYYSTTHTTATATDALSTNTWAHIAVRWDEGVAPPTIYVDGASAGGTTPSGTWRADASYDLTIGRKTASTLYADGDIDEFRMAKNIFTANWVTTEYNQGNAPASFIVEGTPGDSAAGLEMELAMHHYKMMIKS